MQDTIDLTKYSPFIDNFSMVKKQGRVNRITGLIMESHGPAVGLGALCTVHSRQKEKTIDAEVVGFRDNKILLMALGDMAGIEPGSLIVAREEFPTVNVSHGLLGRVIDGNGVPLDGKGPIAPGKEYPLQGTPINPLERRRVREALDVGVGAINGLMTIGKGQRIGIMSGTVLRANIDEFLVHAFA